LRFNLSDLGKIQRAAEIIEEKGHEGLEEASRVVDPMVALAMLVFQQRRFISTPLTLQSESSREEIDREVKQFLIHKRVIIAQEAA
jgi:predicted acetyltransferase